ncbi:hypothetical protein SAMN05880574_10146 [Chryseobacterium sp. RU37D]|uniref:DUF6660 family protein n=1 Tax=Chryseobacterium sp. RU37D TaxID=1907397 RepID=UPI000955BD40|nr:DUF6660 family protein [Chryseobacterium sp. RU37D]SIP86311.1 hypothetical protein SAMN05880574_10146 [Chryseobacterium sp. RU37D]
MNTLRLLLIIYFAVLVILPCNDAKAQSYSGEITKISSYSEDSHSKDKGDICSPLCICNCCQMAIGSFKIEPVLNLPKHIKTYFSKKILFQKNDFAYLVYDRIWQPPKI